MRYLTDAIGLLFVPKLIQKFESKKLFVASGVFAILSGVLVLPYNLDKKKTSETVRAELEARRAATKA